MIDLTNWAAGHRGGIDGILAFLVLAMGSMCTVAVDMLLSTECPKCGERPQIGKGPRMCERFPSVSCRCASEWGGDLCEAARKWAYTTGVYWQCLER